MYKNIKEREDILYDLFIKTFNNNIDNIKTFFIMNHLIDVIKISKYLIKEKYINNELFYYNDESDLIRIFYSRHDFEIKNLKYITINRMWKFLTRIPLKSVLDYDNLEYYLSKI